MTTSADVLCGSCERQDITKNADYWCPECEEGLCSDCLKYHKTMKPSKNHQVISVGNFRKLPRNISSIGSNCKKHDKLYQHYCKQHESFCCPVCMATDHKNCDDFLVIDDIIKTAKSSSMLESIETDLKFLKNKLQLIIDERVQNLKKNKTHQESFLNNIKTARERMKAHFDKLEQQILHEVLIAEEHNTDRINKFSKELKEKLQAVEELEQDVVAVKDYASGLQTCLGSIRLKTKVEEVKKYINFLAGKEALKQLLLKCSLDENVLANILSVTRLGSVSTEEITTEICLDTRSTKQAQIMIGPIASVQNSNHEIHLTLKCKFKLPTSETSYFITGCAIRPDDKIILVDRNSHQLLMIKETGDLEKKINMSQNGPTDITYVDDKTICVSYCNGNQIDLINTDSFEITQVIKTSRPCCGITSENGTLYWYEQGKGIQMKQQSSNDINITTLVKSNDCDYWSYVSAHAGRIYQTNEKQRTVTCFKLDGEKVWELKDDSMIHKPAGIANDNWSNVYFADHPEGVFIMSTDGKNCRQILGMNDGIYGSYNLCFEKHHKLLVVVTDKEQVFIYSVS